MNLKFKGMDSIHHLILKKNKSETWIIWKYKNNIE